MCVVSMVTEHFGDKWNQPNEWWKQLPETQSPNGIGGTQWTLIAPKPPTQAEIEEFRKLLDRAREYDKRNNQPDCELETKKDVLRQMAKVWGIDISFIDKGVS